MHAHERGECHMMAWGARQWAALTGRKRARVGAIGIDFAAERLNLVQVEWPDGQRRLRAAASLAYPAGGRAALLAAPTELKQFVQSALASAPFSGRRVYSALPAGDVRILPMTVLVGPGMREQQVVAKAAREQLGAAADAAVIDYYHVRSADGASAERQVLVAVASHDAVSGYLAMLASARLEAVALDIGPAAIARLLGALHQDDFRQSVMLINFGAAKSFLTVIWGRRLMLDREIDFGEDQLAGKLASALRLAPAVALALMREHGIGTRASGANAMHPAQADVGRAIREIVYPDCLLLAEELVRTQVYVASRTRGSTISRIYLNGSLARYPNIQQRISELVALPVQVLNPFDAFNAFEAAHSGGAELQPTIALATGLALREEPDG
jgi:type IV pilus assembly protein PilM